MSKYVNGYMEKIGYWQYKLNKAVEALDANGVEYASSKLAYFVKRQAEVYGGGIHNLQEVGEFSPLVKKYFKNNYE